MNPIATNGLVLNKRPIIVWEDEEVEFLKLAWNEGMSTKDIQDNLRKTKRAVLSKVALLNLAKRRIGLDVSKTAIDEYEAGYKSDEVAKSAGVNNQTFRNLIKRHTPRRELSNRDIETISDRHEDGCSASCIAQRIQRSTLIVKDFIKKAQLDIDSIPTDKLVLSLESDGFTTAQIAMKLELPLVAITNAYKRLRGKGKQNV
ncbi:MAG: hypothetical protein COB59_11160 [Rhodospirillaceae bacterium]|nr:MAG: hypothetical protein COB59_11160 [Rhodospirillaceae bacterium]